MEIETTIIGAGVIGLAIAAELSKHCRNIYVIESNATFGNAVSSRSGEVVHAGLFYPQGSLKARLCVEGHRLLRRTCRERQIPFRMCGKLIVATSEKESAQLELLARPAQDSGVTDLDLLSGAACRKLEPQLNAVAALYSPTTGIVDSRQLIRHFVAQAGMNGVTFVYQTKIKGVEMNAQGQYGVQVAYPDGETEKFFTQRIINAAGLEADQIAATMGIDIDRHRYRQYFWKGEYFSVEWQGAMLGRLIYPVPDPEMTQFDVIALPDLSGRIKLRSTSTYMPERELDYTVDPRGLDACLKAVRRYLPQIGRDDLRPEMAGIQPKLRRPGEPLRDFIIQEESDKGLPGVVNLVGIESPGLTSSMAIARYVKRLIE